LTPEGRLFLVEAQAVARQATDAADLERFSDVEVTADAGSTGSNFAQLQRGEVDGFVLAPAGDCETPRAALTAIKELSCMRRHGRRR
jgi:hypothetical protein